MINKCFVYYFVIAIYCSSFVYKQFQFAEESVRERVHAREYENEPNNSQSTMSSVGQQRKCQLVAFSVYL